MEELLLLKIQAIAEQLANEPGYFRAADFDHDYENQGLLALDPNGRTWNGYVHENANAFGFQIYMAAHRNWYVRNDRVNGFLINHPEAVLNT